MALSGVSPTNPRPAIRREYVFAAGPSSGSAPDRPVLLIGNNTSAGSEADDLIGDPIIDDADAKARLGARSEAYAMYRAFVAVPQDATIYVLCPTESGGAASSVELTISGASDASSGWEIHVHGETISVSVESGATQTATATAIALALNSHDEGRLQVTSVAAIDGAGPDYKVTVTAAQAGDRGTQIIGATATRGIRVKATGPTNAMTLVKNTGAHVAGGADDDWTAASVQVATGEWYYQALAKTAVATVNATDNGLGEHQTMITAQALPINGKDQRTFYTVVGTNAENTAVGISAAMNSVYGHGFWMENSDWSSAMISAHCMAVVRQQELAHPAANINGWTAGDGKIFSIPAPFLKADYPTNAEIVTALNNGSSPISFVGGRVVLERFVTTRSLNAAGNNDYRAREGHIPSVVHFFWSIARQRYESIRQPFADDEPTGDLPPTARTMIPSTIKSMLHGWIDEAAGSYPLSVYAGPLLKPSAAAAMKASTRVLYAGGGSFPTEQDIAAVEHDIKWETTLREVGDSY